MRIRLGTTSVDLSTGEVRQGDERGTLRPKEVQLLTFLHANRERAVSREELLARVWESAPGVVTRTVDQTVARLRRAIEATPSDPKHLVTVYGEGYRLLVDEAPRVPTRLPAETVPLFGREGELDRLAELVRAHRLVSIVGPGGAGKTRLVTAFAWREAASPSRPWEGVYLGACETGSRPVVAVLAEALGVGQPEDAAALADRIGQRTVLVVLDEAENAPDAPATVQALLTKAPNLVIVTTTRERLKLRAERLLALDGLGRDALALFEDVIARTGRELRAEERESAAILCEKVDGLPLGVELAAGAAACSDARTVLAELRSAGDTPSSDLADVPERQRSLRAVFEGSWRRLGPGLQRSLAALAVFAGVFDERAAEAVAGATLEDLGELRDRSLIGASPRGWRLSAFVRDLAREHQGDAEAARERHRKHLAARSTRWLADARGPGQEQALAEGVAWIADVLDAMDSAAAAGDHEALDALASAAAWISGEVRVREIAGRLEALLARGGLPSALRGRVLADWGRMLVASGRIQGMDAVADEALALAATPEDRANALFLRSLLAEAAGNAALAGAALEEAAAAAREAGRPELEARRLARMAEVDGRQGRLARAAEGYERAARAYEALGMRTTAATVWLDTATCWYEQGRFDEAVDRIGRIYDALPPFGRARADNALGNVARRRGNVAEAERAYLAAREAFRREGSRYAEAVTVQNLGAVARMRGDLAAAERLVREAIALHEETGRVRPQADALLTLGNVLLARGDGASAADAYRRCASLGAAACDEKLVLAANVNLGAVELEAGRAARAVADLEAAREAAQRLGDRGVTVAIASVLGLAMAVAGDPRAADTVAGALDAALDARVRPELMRSVVAAGYLLPDLADAAWLHAASDPATTPTDRARARAALGAKPRAVAAIPEDELLTAILAALRPATSSRAG